MSDEYIGKTLVWYDPESGEQREDTITEVGPMPYLWVKGSDGEGFGVPERDWVEIRDE
jgi:hypothetical protein